MKVSSDLNLGVKRHRGKAQFFSQCICHSLVLHPSLTLTCLTPPSSISTSTLCVVSVSPTQNVPRPVTWPALDTKWFKRRFVCTGTWRAALSLLCIAAPQRHVISHAARCWVRWPSEHNDSTLSLRLRPPDLPTLTCRRIWGTLLLFLLGLNSSSAQRWDIPTPAPQS